MVTNQGHSKCCDLIWRYVYISVLSLALATNTTTLTLFILMVLVGLVLYYYFQYPTRKFPSSTELWEFWELKYKISNSEIHVSFLGLRQNVKKPVPNDGTESGPGKGCSRMFKTLLFPIFLREISGSLEMAFGNADL